MIEPEELPEVDESQVTDISQAEVKSVHAESVRMHQADAELIDAATVQLEQSAAANVKAEKLHAHQSALVTVNAGEVLVEEGAVGYVQAEKVSVSGVTGVVVAGSAEVHHGMAGFVAGRDVHVQESRTAVLIARNITGDVTTLLDTRHALIAGLIGGLFAGLMLLLGRLLFRRD